MNVLHFCDIFQDHVYIIVNAKDYHHGDELLTDKVIKTEQCSAEFCDSVSDGGAKIDGSCLPLSPFIITHIFEPTHLSINSRGKSCVAIVNALSSRTQ